MVLQPIVEGKGEISAARELLSRLMTAAACFEMQVASPIKQNSSQLMTEAGIARAVAIARQTDFVSGILIIFDGDLPLLRDDGSESYFCPKTDLPALATAAKGAAAGVPCEIVVACMEYEAWLLAGIEGLKEAGKVRPDCNCPENFETIRGAKGRLASFTPDGRYIETIHQVAFTNYFDLASAFRRSRSFRRMVSAFGGLHLAAGVVLDNWPPAEWTAATLP